MNHLFNGGLGHLNLLFLGQNSSRMAPEDENLLCATCQTALGIRLPTKTTQTCFVCLGVFQETFAKRLEDAIRTMVEPYRQFVKFSSDNNTINLPGDLIYRFTSRGNQKACADYTQQLKQYGKDTLRKCLRRIEMDHATTEILNSFPSCVKDEQQGHLSVAVVVLPTVTRPPLDTSHQNKSRKKRKKRTYEEVSQGGDPRDNLERRIEQQGKVVWSINSSTQPVGGAWDPPKDEALTDVEIHVAVWRRPFYVKSCYTKTRRDVSQTPFVVVDAGVARTRGVTSVEEQIVPILTQHVGGISTSNNNEDSNLVYGKCKFHASGREDLDVKMLLPSKPNSDITGRPFVCEVTDALEIPLPTVTLPKIVREINHGDESPSHRSYGSNPLGVGIAPELAFCPSSSYKNLQAETEDKVKFYGCYCWSEKPVTQEILDKFTALFPLKIQQATPIRVLHRRTNMKRTRYVLSYQGTVIDEHHFQLHISTTAGTYVKEFVHSDLGRTIPSMASLLGCHTDLLKLDCEGIQMSPHTVADSLE